MGDTRFFEISFEMIYKRYVYANNDCRGSIHEFLKMYFLSWKHCT